MAEEVSLSAIDQSKSLIVRSNSAMFPFNVAVGMQLAPEQPANDQAKRHSRMMALSPIPSRFSSETGTIREYCWERPANEKLTKHDYHERYVTEGEMDGACDGACGESWLKGVVRGGVGFGCGVLGFVRKSRRKRRACDSSELVFNTV